MPSEKPDIRSAVVGRYVETGGCYFGLRGIDPWEEARDAPAGRSGVVATQLLVGRANAPTVARGRDVRSIVAGLVGLFVRGRSGRPVSVFFRCRLAFEIRLRLVAVAVASKVAVLTPVRVGRFCASVAHVNLQFTFVEWRPNGQRAAAGPAVRKSLMAGRGRRTIDFRRLAA